MDTKDGDSPTIEIRSHNGEWGTPITDKRYIEGGINLHSTVDRLDISIDQVPLPSLDTAYGMIGDMAVSYEGWTKWHYIRSYGVSICGRTFYGREVLIVRKDALYEIAEVCTVCERNEY